MHSATVFFALAALASASAGAIGGLVGHPIVAADIISRPAYKYSYSVSDKLTGDQKSASEVRDGDLTKGSYSLVQPDGVLRTVNYVSTPLTGFQAQVINSNAAVHPGRAVIAAAPVVAAGPAVVGVNGLGLGLNRGLVGLNGLNGLNGGLIGLNGGLVGLNGLNGGLVGLNGGLVGLNGGLVGLNGLNGGLIGLNGGLVGLNGLNGGLIGLNGGHGGKIIG